jgi:hypothetical protein
MQLRVGLLPSHGDGIKFFPDPARRFLGIVHRPVRIFGMSVRENGLALFAGIDLRAAGAVVRGLADGVLGCEHGSTHDKGFGELERFALQVVDGAHGVNGFCLLSAGGDGGSDLKPIEHEAGAAAVHGLEVEGSHDLPDGEEDGGGVFDGRYFDPVPAVHAVEFHVEEAIRLALEGGGVATLSIVLDTAALVKHDDFSFGGPAARLPGRGPPPPGGSIVLNGLETNAAANICND